MPYNKHPKKDRARKMLEPKEVSDGVSPFNGYNWRRERFYTKKRVAKKQADAHKRAELRKKKVKAGVLGIGQTHMERRTSRYAEKK